MYIPASAAELEECAATGDLTETAIFEAKRDVPLKPKTIDLAIDVAALACDGGVLIYGLGEDQHKRLTVLAPFALAGVRERIYSIVLTCVAEPPKMEIIALPTDADPTIGYIVIVVLPSPRAPHMVVKGGDMRFYGRGPVGNVTLSEGDVARLYARRQQYEVDRDALLADEIQRAPLPPQSQYAFLHLVFQPVIRDEGILDRLQAQHAVASRDPRLALANLVNIAASDETFRSRYAPDFSPGLPWQAVADGYRVTQGYNNASDQWDDPRYVLTYQVDNDGSGHLFCGRAGERSNVLSVVEQQIVGLTVRMVRLLGGVYVATGYVGPVDAGIAVTGIDGAISSQLNSERHSRPLMLGFDSIPRYDRAEYRRTGRFMADRFAGDPNAIARELTAPLYRVTTNNLYDPFDR